MSTLHVPQCFQLPVVICCRWDWDCWESPVSNTLIWLWFSDLHFQVWPLDQSKSWSSVASGGQVLLLVTTLPTPMCLYLPPPPILPLFLRPGSHNGVNCFFHSCYARHRLGSIFFCVFIGASWELSAAAGATNLRPPPIQATSNHLIWPPLTTSINLNHLKQPRPTATSTTSTHVKPPHLTTSNSLDHLNHINQR